LGQVGSPFGLEGFVKVKSFSGETDHFTRLQKVTLSAHEKEETREVAEVIIQRDAADTLLLRFKGIDSPEAAKLLRGALIITDREHAAPLKNGEFYVEDLIGLEVVSNKSEILGHIANVIEGGGGNLAEVELLSGEKRLVPFRNEFFGETDLKTGRMILLEPWILE